VNFNNVFYKIIIQLVTKKLESLVKNCNFYDKTWFQQWVIVPKPLKEAHGVVDAWRVNFYQYEMEILRDYGRIKPAIKLIKVDNTH
jgi:hypothetical protein